MLAVACAPSEPAPAPQPGLVTVASVTDGDSFRASRDRQDFEVRLTGINAPELDECHGAEAAAQLDNLIGGRTVQITALGEDQFGRTLAMVSIEDTNINRTMVAGGHAIATSDADLLPTQDEARVARVGLWSPTACGIDDPRLPSLEIASIDYNPTGDDANERVTIANTGTDPVDLANFQLRDESSVNRYVFPAVVIQPGEQVIVNTGCDQEEGLSWCSPQPVWNNAGDSALLLDPDGRVVAFFGY